LTGTLVSELPTPLRSVALIMPVPLGMLLGIILYFRLAHEVVQYDENGFTLTKGRMESKSYKWDQFSELSLFSDPKGGVSIRMYYQPDGEHIDVPASRTGIDPFSLRSALLSRLSKGSQ
jgi:hypothetical protein